MGACPFAASGGCIAGGHDLRHSFIWSWHSGFTAIGTHEERPRNMKRQAMGQETRWRALGSLCSASGTTRGFIPWGLDHTERAHLWVRLWMPCHTVCLPGLDLRPTDPWASWTPHKGSTADYSAALGAAP